MDSMEDLRTSEWLTRVRLPEVLVRQPFLAVVHRPTQLIILFNVYYVSRKMSFFIKVSCSGIHIHLKLFWPGGYTKAVLKLKDHRLICQGK